MICKSVFKVGFRSFGKFRPYIGRNMGFWKIVSPYIDETSDFEKLVSLYIGETSDFEKLVSPETIRSTKGFPN